MGGNDMTCSNESCCKHGECIKNGHVGIQVTGNGFGSICRRCGEVNIPVNYNVAEELDLPEEFRGGREAPWGD